MSTATKTKPAEPVVIDKFDTTQESQPLAAVPQAEPSNWLSVIDKMLDKGVGAELLAKVFEMQQQVEREQQRRAFVQAFAAFKAEAPSAIERTGKVGYESRKPGADKVSYEHVKLDVACNLLVPIMSKYGLAHSWETTQADGGIIAVTCRLEHTAGHSKSVTLRALPDTSGAKNAIQAVGSAMTYLERYTFMAVVGMAQKHGDDDAGGDGGPRISEENVAWVEKMLDETGSDRVKFLQLAKAESVDDITQKQFPDLRDLLKEKKRQMEGVGAKS